MTPRWPGLWWSLGGAGLITVTALSLLPLPADLPQPPGEDLTLHVIAWCGLTAWFMPISRRPAWMALGLAAYSLGLEGLQSLSPHRYAEAADAVANGVGVVLGYGLGIWLGASWVDYSEGRLSALMAWIRSLRRA